MLCKEKSCFTDLMTFPEEVKKHTHTKHEFLPSVAMLKGKEPNLPNMQNTSARIEGMSSRNS